MGSRTGFTLIELVIVIAIIGILASLAVPKYIDMSTRAKLAATAGGLGSLRSLLATRYAASATGGGVASYPNEISVTDFADGKCPPNLITGATTNCVKALAATQPGTDACMGPLSAFWYVTDPDAGLEIGSDYGKAGACSDGVTDLSGL